MKVRLERRFDGVHTEAEVRDVPLKTLDGVRTRFIHWLRAPNVVEDRIVRLDVPGHYYFDYANQAFVLDGKYVDCHHLAPTCGCFGRAHKGEIVVDWSEVS